MEYSNLDFEHEMKAELRTYIDLLLRWERYLHYQSILWREIETVAEESKQHAETIKELARNARQQGEAELADLEKRIPHWNSYLKRFDEIQKMRPRKKGRQPFLIEP